METKTKVYGYVRVSTQDQENSLEVQEKRIREYCQFKHLDLVEIFVDENVSGYSEFEKRPEGCKLTKLLTKNVKAIVAVKPDRLFRNTSDALLTVESWDKMGIELHMIDIGGATLATKTATGKMIFTILIAFAQFERDTTGERVKVVLKNKKETGKAYAGSVFGYDKTGGILVNGKLKNQKLIPNEEEQKTISVIMDLKKVYKADRICRILNTTGYRTKTNKRFHPSTVRAIIGNSIHDAN